MTNKLDCIALLIYLSTGGPYAYAIFLFCLEKGNCREVESSCYVASCCLVINLLIRISGLFYMQAFQKFSSVLHSINSLSCSLFFCVCMIVLIVFLDSFQSRASKIKFHCRTWCCQCHLVVKWCGFAVNKNWGATTFDSCLWWAVGICLHFQFKFLFII